MSRCFDDSGPSLSTASITFSLLLLFRGWDHFHHWRGCLGPSWFCPGCSGSSWLLHSHWLWYSRWFWFDTDNRKKVVWGFNASNGTNRNGYQWDGNTYLTWKMQSNFELTNSFTWINIDGSHKFNDGGRNDFMMYRIRGRYSPTLNLTFRATFQYRFDYFDGEFGTPEDESLTMNYLLSWNWAPGSWLYLVYDQSVYNEFDEDDELINWTQRDQTIRMKMTYFFSSKI